MALFITSTLLCSNWISDSLSFLFRHHYAGQLWRLYLVEPPFVVWLLWFICHNILAGFALGTKVRCIDASRYHEMIVESCLESQLKSSFDDRSTTGSHSEDLDKSTFHSMLYVEDSDTFDTNSSSSSLSSDAMLASPTSENGSACSSRLSYIIDQAINSIPHMIQAKKHHDYPTRPERSEASFATERVAV
jgi:hypothetical protein